MVESLTTVNARFIAVQEVSGQSVIEAALVVDTWISAQTSDPAGWIILNLGTNDFLSMPSQAQFEADYAYILDALHAKWPTATVLAVKPWGSSTLNPPIVAGWIANVLATRGAWTVTTDESTYLPGLLEADGIHPTLAGYTATAAALKAAMGY